MSQDIPAGLEALDFHLTGGRPVAAFEPIPVSYTHLTLPTIYSV